MPFEGAEEAIGRLESERVRLRTTWMEGEAYAVALLTSTGGTIDHEIPVAAETPDADLSFFGLMALLGIYVGVIPVALGMLWLPWIRRIPPSWLRAVMAITVGLLVVLGAWMGAGAYNASAAAFLFGLGAGAIVQVVVQLAPALRDGEGRTLHPVAVAGLLAGTAVMIGTGLLVSV